MLHSDLEYAAIDALKGFGDVGLLSLRGDAQRAHHFQLHFARKRFEVFARSLKPSNRSRIPHSGYFDKFVNTCKGAMLNQLAVI